MRPRARDCPSCVKCGRRPRRSGGYLYCGPCTSNILQFLCRVGYLQPTESTRRHERWQARLHPDSLISA